MECVGKAPKVSQNKDLNQTNAEPNMCDILSKINRDISHWHFEI